MPQPPRYEQQFLSALKSIFIGAKVEGESGYINLMKIKAAYFETGVFPQLQKDLDLACRPFEKGFREELFDKLYDFFSRYFSESGSIYFPHTPSTRTFTSASTPTPGWTTPAEFIFTSAILNSMLDHTEALIKLKNQLIEGSKAVVSK